MEAWQAAREKGAGLPGAGPWGHALEQQLGREVFLGFSWGLAVQSL